MLILLLTPLSATGSPAENESTELKHVLLLNSYHRGFTWTRQLTSTVSEAFAERPDLQLHIEDMDTKRRSPESMESSLLEFYKSKFADMKFSVVLATDNNALAFLKRHHIELFPGTPIVFCGINYFSEDLLDDSGLFTGVVETTAPLKTIELIKQLHPEANRCAFITDSSSTSQAEMSHAIKAFSARDPGLEILWLSDLTSDDLVLKLSKLNPDTDVALVTLFNRDAEGKFFSIESSSRMIVEAAPCPVYGLWDFYLGSGIVGGHMTSARDQAGTMARMALEILDGSSPTDLPIIRESPNKTFLDVDGMRRFNIRYSALPSRAWIWNAGRTTLYDREFPTIRTGVLAKRGIDSCLNRWEATADYLTEKVAGYSFEIVPLTFDEVEPAVREREIDLLFTNPTQFVELDVKYGLTALASLKTTRLGKTYSVYGGVIFCAADRDDIRQLKDLRSKRFAAVDPESLGGWQMAWLELVRNDIDPYRDFSSLRFLDTHDAVVWAVLKGEIEAGTIRTDTLEWMEQEGKIKLEDIRILNRKDETEEFAFARSTALYPDMPFTALPHVPDNLAADVAGALVAMPADSRAAQNGGNSGWRVALSYQPVHELQKELSVGAYTNFGKFTYMDVLKYYWPWILAVLVVIFGSISFAVRFSQLNRYTNRLAATLAANEERLRAITTSAQDAIVVIDPKGDISFWNQSAERIFGYGSEEVIGRNMHDLIAPKRYLDAHQNAFKRFMHSGEGAAVGKTLELEGVHKNGSEISVELSLSAIEMPDGWHAAGIMRDISDRKASERALEESMMKANQMAVEAELANQAKSQFLANMSHEIRTPMNGIIGMTGLLLESDLTEEQRTSLRIVRTCGDQLLSLINDILDFSKIEAGKLEMESLELNLTESVEDVTEILSLKAEEKGLDLNCFIDPEIPERLLGDPGRLKQILINLVGNAVKFTEHGEVFIRVNLESRRADAVRIHVSVLDSGIGIPEDRKGLLFDSFSQVDASTTRKYGGSGLGLAISRLLCELMNGEIGVKSDLGKGSNFWFTIELKTLPDQPQEPEFKGAFKGAGVVLLERHATTRNTIARYLKYWGCDVREAETCHEALQMVRSDPPPELSIIDCNRVKCTEHPLCGSAHTWKKESATRLAAINPYGKVSLEQGMSERGFDWCLHRPIRKSQLLHCLSAACQDSSAVSGELILDVHLSTSDLELPLPDDLKVLLAEDNVVNQKVALMVLEKKLGIRADAVANGAEALDALAKVDYDIVLMDCQMPEVDGFEATRRIRNRESSVINHDVPIIAMTANAMKGDREACLAAGMDDYISKPVRPEDLLRLMRNIYFSTRKPQIHN